MLAEITPYVQPKLKRIYVIVKQQCLNKRKWRNKRTRVRSQFHQKIQSALTAQKKEKVKMDARLKRLQAIQAAI